MKYQMNRRGFSGLALAAISGYALEAKPVVASEMNTNVQDSKRPGLLVLFHGSPDPQWNSRAEKLVGQVREMNEKCGIFHAVEGSLMEFAQPDAAAGIEKLETVGCDRIIVVPAFVFPTSHSHFDVPAVLGLYTSPSVRKTLQEENARVARPQVPITMTATLSEGDLLDRYLCNEAKKCSKKPSNETLLVMAHGDAAHEGLITPVMERITKKAAESVGISQYEWAYCGMGQRLYRDLTSPLERLGKDGKTVLILGVWLASSPRDIRESAEMMMTHGGKNNHDKQEHSSVKNPFDGIDTRLSDGAIIDNPSTPGFVYTIAKDALM